jgi:hypothetical protein
LALLSTNPSRTHAPIVPIRYIPVKWWSKKLGCGLKFIFQ